MVCYLGLRGEALHPDSGLIYYYRAVLRVNLLVFHLRKQSTIFPDRPVLTCGIEYRVLSIVS